ncbi:MAG: hypothetical protein HKN16_03395, partial [Saprospiraceae bacterium]|nr:hypothetical protein [Saprospiraceae bacterium]
MKFASLVTILFLTYSPLISQNQDHFFKSVPILQESEPAWVHLMYAENPNVYEVIDLYEQFYKTNQFEKNLHTQNYKNWLFQTATYVTDEGFIEYENEARKLFVNQLKNKRSQLKEGRADYWSCLGPFETYANDGQLGVIPVSWQINVYCMDQSVTNPNLLFAGTEGQGAWRSVDKGLNWDLITKGEDIGGVTDIKVAASNENIVYLAGGGQIYRSLDMGNTWEAALAVNHVYQIVIHPSNPNIVFAVGPDGFYKTQDGGATWTTQFTGRYWDINFHPTDPSIVYLLRHDPVLSYTEFLKSTDTGSSWTQKTTGWYDPVNPDFVDHVDFGSLIAVTPLEPNKVYVAMLGNHKAQDNFWIGVYQSEDSGESWANPLQDGGPYHDTNHPNLATSGLTSGFSQTFYDFAFDASHTEPGKLFLGVLALSISGDDGNSWQRVGGYSTPSANDVRWFHPDVQDIHILGEDVWVATDGGINYSTDQFQTHESRKNGLAGSHFWGLGQGWNEDVLVGGRYHNGNTALYNVYGVGNSSRLGGAEAPTGYVDVLNSFKTYFSDINTRILDPFEVGKFTSSSKLAKFPHEAYFHAQHSEIERDPRYVHHIYLGAEANGEDGGFWKSIDNGSSFELLHNFGSEKVTGIEVSRSNPDVLYCVYGANQVFRSADQGINWTNTAVLPAGAKLISINPEDENELWVFAHTNNNNDKVFRTKDGGSSWQNLTTPNISGFRINDGFYQGGTESTAYFVSPYGMFYWEDQTNDW